MLGDIPKITFSQWRPSDQKVYISDISKINRELKWKPAISVKEGIKRIITWARNNKHFFTLNSTKST